MSGNDYVEIVNTTPVTGYDSLVVNDLAPGPSTVTLGGTLTVSDSYVPVTNSEVFWIVVNNTSNALSGTFGSVVGLPSGWQVLYNVNYDPITPDLTPNSGNDVAILVPEPATLAMLIIAAGLCLVFKRRSK